MRKKHLKLLSYDEEKSENRDEKKEQRGLINAEFHGIGMSGQV
jgi:hypothetical protein